MRLSINYRFFVSAFVVAVTSCGSIPKTIEWPSPFKSEAGKAISNTNEWMNLRRPELKKIFQEDIYGIIPPALAASYTVKEASILKTKTFRLKEIEITFKQFAGRPYAPKMRLALFLPLQKKSAKAADKKFPVFLALNKCGNQEVDKSEEITLQKNAWLADLCTLEGWDKRGGRKDFWPIEYILSQGYGFATFHESDIEPDTSITQPNSLRNFLKSSDDPKKNWGTIAIWAWGLSRALDYLVTDNDVDANKVIAVGHSRRGKAALLAAAMDERFAMVIPHQSGTFGMALSRNNDQETVAKINDSFPHWFSGRAKDFNGHEEKLPVDQHLLVALMAPRPVLSTEGTQDAWANFESGLQNLKLADEVYRFLGAKGLATPEPLGAKDIMTKANTGRLAQVRLDTAHLLNKDYWQKFIEFANLQFAPTK